MLFPFNPYYYGNEAALTVSGGGGGGESYAFVAMQDQAIPGNSVPFTMSIPAGYVVVAVTLQGGSFVSVTCGLSTTLNQDILNTAGGTTAIYSGIVSTPSSSLTVVSSGNAYGDTIVCVWVISNIVTASYKQKTEWTGTNGSINVTAGDYLFSANSNAGTYTGSTQSPSNTYSVATINNGPQYASDWNIASTNSSFAVVSSGYGYNVAASYH